MKRAFTIVELLMVVAIIGILLSITVSAASGAITRARSEQSRASVLAVNQGAAVYYAQQGYWPGPIGSRIKNGTVIQTENGGKEEYYSLTASEVRDTVKEMVLLARDGTPVMDVSSLFVSRRSGEKNGDYGMDFLSAIRGTKKSGLKMTTSEMYYGYPEKEHGYFRRFHAKYYPRTDQLVFEKASSDD